MLMVFRRLDEKLADCASDQIRGIFPTTFPPTRTVVLGVTLTTYDGRAAELALGWDLRVGRSQESQS
jgi:hypothetical protein